MQGYGTAPPVPIIASVFGGIAAFALALAVLCTVCRRRRGPRGFELGSRSSAPASELPKLERGWSASSTAQQSQDGRSVRLPLTAAEGEHGFSAASLPPASVALVDGGLSVCSRASSITNELYFDASEGQSTCGSVGGVSR